MSGTASLPKPGDGCPRWPTCFTCPFSDCRATAIEIVHYDDRESNEKKKIETGKAKELVLKLAAEGMMFVQIAKEVGVTPSTVSVWLAEANDPERYAKILAARKEANRRNSANRKEHMRRKRAEALERDLIACGLIKEEAAL